MYWRISTNHHMSCLQHSLVLVSFTPEGSGNETALMYKLIMKICEVIAYNDVWQYMIITMLCFRGHACVRWPVTVGKRARWMYISYHQNYSGEGT